MEPIDLIALLGGEVEKGDARKLHSAFFLAQSCLTTPLYNFSLSHGRVHSDQFDSDLVFLVVMYAKGATSVRVDHRASDDESGRSLRERLNKLLSEQNEVLEAAATTRFFEKEGLGDPSCRLNWFSALPEPVRRRAKQVEDEILA
jgi:hypothetical protein